jgi:fermentation-respiration switch protein FrsA (DUF1100 family)
MLTPIIISLITIIVFLLAAGYHFARLVIYPKVIPVEETFRQEVENGRLVEMEYLSWPREEVRIRSPFGYDLYSVYHPLEGAQRTIVLTHGISWSLYGMVIYAGLFRRRGFNVLLYDIRHHGRSGGKDTSFGIYEKQDLKAVVDWAFSRLEHGGIVGTAGLSLGAATTLAHAAIDQRIAFAIAGCPFSDLRALLTYRLRQEYHLPPFPLLNVASYFVRHLAGWTFEQASPIQAVSQVETPIFLSHGQNDTYILPQMSIDLYNAKMRGIRALYLAPNAGHAEALWKNPVEYDQKLGAFLQDILPGIMQDRTAPAIQPGRNA